MTTKKQEVRKVPNLRFPGFEGEWEEKQLGSLLEFKNGINASKENYGRGVKFINVLDILNNNFITYDKIIGSVDVQQNVADKYSVNYGDILFQRSSETREEVGTANVYLDREHTATFGGFVIRGRKIGNYNPVFLNELLKTGSARDSITSKSGGSTRFNVGQEILSSIKLLFPEINEQTKIADFLSICDERIEQSSKIIEELKSFKSAVSKKIFSQELRFKDDNGEDFAEWEEKKLGECLDYEQPTKYLVTSTEYEDKYETPVVTAGKTFILGYTNETTGIFEQDLPVIIFDDFTTSTQFVNFPFKAKSSAMKILKATEGLITRFIYEALQMINYEIGGHGRHWISVYEKLEILIPSYPEQAKIADFLTRIDEKIELETSLLQQLKLQKQYFLSQMFI